MMTREERAKQFMPFDAMKGLKEALARVEERHSRTEKREISEEQIEAVSKELSKIEKGVIVNMEYYRLFHDVTGTGIVEKISYTYKFMIVDGEKIFFDDIYTIKIVGKTF